MGLWPAWALFKMSRLSVQPVSRPHFDFIATTLVPSEGPVTNPFHADFEDDGDPSEDEGEAVTRR